MTEPSLRTQLDAIERIESPAQRGRAFEGFVEEIFRWHHFDARSNPKTARPRQTDVLAVKGSERYLIECKWRGRRADVSDVDGLRSRLRRAETGMVGILVSVEGFTGTALFDVGYHRDQPILVISGDQMRQLANRYEELPDLLWRRKQALLSDGQVLLDQPVKRRSRRRPSALPRAESHFEYGGMPGGQVIECEGASASLSSRTNFPTSSGCRRTASGWHSMSRRGSSTNEGYLT